MVEQFIEKTNKLIMKKQIGWALIAESFSELGSASAPGTDIENVDGERPTAE